MAPLLPGFSSHANKRPFHSLFSAVFFVFLCFSFFLAGGVISLSKISSSIAPGNALSAKRL